MRLAVPVMALGFCARTSELFLPEANLALRSTCDFPMPEGSSQMIDEGAYYRRQAAARREDEVDDAVLREPLREDMRQSAARQFASTSVVRQERHTKSGHRGVAKRQEIDTGHSRLMADRARVALWPDELPDDLPHLVGGGERRKIGERCDVSAGAGRRQGRRCDQNSAGASQGAHGQGGIGRERRSDPDRDVDPLIDEVHRTVDSYDL